MKAPEKCECGKGHVVYVNGTRRCSETLAKFRALYGDPKPVNQG